MPNASERHTDAAASPEKAAAEVRACEARAHEASVPGESASASASAPEDADSPRGVFVTFEGGDGVGKSTHIRYVADELRRAGREVVCLREPGGTSVGESLRRVVLDPAHGELSAEAELLIYEAARAQLVSEVIRPALERGAVVLCDRFADSTVAYQAYGRGLPIDFVRRANAFATGGIVPDRTILLVCGNTRASLARACGSGAGDRMEQAGEAFHSRVNRAFLKLAKRDSKRIRTVRSHTSRKATAAAVAAELVDLLPELASRAAAVSAPARSKGHRGASGAGAGPHKPRSRRARGGKGKGAHRG